MSKKHDNYRLDDADAELIHHLISDQLAAEKNWLVSAVEGGKPDLQERTSRIRKLQELYATFNVKVRRDLEAS